MYEFLPMAIRVTWTLAAIVGVVLAVLFFMKERKPKRRITKRRKNVRRINWSKVWATLKLAAGWFWRTVKAIWGAAARFFRWLKKHLPKRKKRRGVPRASYPSAVPSPPRAKTSGWVVAAWIIAFLFLLGRVLAIVVLLLPLALLWFTPEVQEQMRGASTSIPPETISEIAGLILRFVLAALGWRVV